MHIPQHARGEASAQIGSFDADGISCARLRRGELRSERRQVEAVDSRGLTRHAVVVHGVDPVGGDVHLKPRAAHGSENIKNAFHGDAAQRQVIGELSIV